MVDMDCIFLYGLHDLHGSFIKKLYDLTFHYYIFILFIILSISSFILLFLLPCHFSVIHDLSILI